MLRDLEFFKTKLQHIDGFGDTANSLMEIINAKQVKSISPPPSEKKSSEEKPAEATKAGDAISVAEENSSLEKKDAVESDVKNGD